MRSISGSRRNVSGSTAGKVGVVNPILSSS
jgi:hypothetical protein